MQLFSVQSWNLIRAKIMWRRKFTERKRKKRKEMKERKKDERWRKQGIYSNSTCFLYSTIYSIYMFKHPRIFTSF